MPPKTALTPTATHPFTGRDLPWLLATQAHARADHPFLVWDPFDGAEARWTYGEFARDVARLAAGLVARGVAAGDRILIHLGNCPEFLIAYFACARVGAISVTTNTRSTVDELAYYAANANVTAAITQPQLLETVRAAAPALRWIACTATDLGAAPAAPPPIGVLGFADLFGDESSAPSRAAEPLAPNSVQYTSGTTSRPKGVVWTHANALWGARIGSELLHLRGSDVTLVYLPLYHTNAISYSTLSTLWSGGTIVLHPKFSASRFWDAIIRHGCTWFIGIPFSLLALVKQPKPGPHRVRFIGLGASDVSILREVWGLRSLGWFGMTETVTLTIMSEHGWPGREMAMGVPVPGYEIKVVRDDGTEVAFGESGHLKIRGIPGISLFLEYLGNQQATDACFDADGWFSTGDRVTPFADGQIRFDMRDKDMLRVGAENVAAAEIERVIFASGAVAEVAVVGAPDEMLEEVPVAYVIPLANTPDLADRLLARCRAELADFKIPRRIIVVADLPRVTLEKIDKKALRLRLREAR
ncbi:MAG: AMP-binding protein [Gammaproteobacteria bacterium]|nr:AMP-binding protein [Gammaproteobacteria bacterium]